MLNRTVLHTAAATYASADLHWCFFTYCSRSRSNSSSIKFNIVVRPLSFNNNKSFALFDRCVNMHYCVQCTHTLNTYTQCFALVNKPMQCTHWHTFATSMYVFVYTMRKLSHTHSKSASSSSGTNNRSHHYGNQFTRSSRHRSKYVEWYLFG